MRITTRIILLFASLLWTPPTEASDLVARIRKTVAINVDTNLKQAVPTLEPRIINALLNRLEKKAPYFDWKVVPYTISDQNVQFVCYFVAMNQGVGVTVKMWSINSQSWIEPNGKHQQVLKSADLDYVSLDKSDQALERYGSTTLDLLVRTGLIIPLFQERVSIVPQIHIIKDVFMLPIPRRNVLDYQIIADIYQRGGPVPEKLYLSPETEVPAGDRYAGAAYCAAAFTPPQPLTKIELGRVKGRDPNRDRIYVDPGQLNNARTAGW